MTEEDGADAAQHHNSPVDHSHCHDETSSPTSSPSSMDVRMMECVTTNLTVDGVRMSIQPLLKLMDLCTCAAAERHTGVNCVTVSMGDVVFETYPQCGDLLELVARPVLVGRTSLDISLTVTAEGGDGIKRMVCEASFVYVTTKGPNGEKRLCPSLPTNRRFESERLEWETRIAEHRRNLLKVERTTFNEPGDENDQQSTQCDLETREVVLPFAQNHMDHTFGGQVMAWMAKAAVAVAARKSRRSFSTLVVRAILRIDFSTGSHVSDHLILRTRLNAVFDEGRSAEVEVKVSKQRLDSGEETKMNVGYFFISGSSMGTGTDVPFVMDSTVMESRFYRKASWIRTQLLARRQLLGRRGDPIQWHPSLHKDATVLTIKSLLRLVNYKNHDGIVKEHDVPIVPASAVVESMRWANGESVGRSDTFFLEVKGTLSGWSLASLIDIIRTQRPTWDDWCQDIEILEQDPDSMSSFPYDIVMHTALLPQAESGKDTDPVVAFCLLRTWQINHELNTAIFASQSVLHDAATFVRGRVLPSGWFLREVDSQIHLTYMAEHDFGPLRKVSGMSDEAIVGMLARIAYRWFEKFQDMQKTT